MCQQVYLGSNKVLPEIEWDNSQPQFYLKAAGSTEEAKSVQHILRTPYLYRIGSFMGCSCGLICDSAFQQQEPETYEHRLRDISLLQNYLTQCLPNNNLKLFVTSWDEFPDRYPQENFGLCTLDAVDFELPENVVLTVTVT